MSRYGRNWIENIVWLLITASVLLGIIVGYAPLSGCTQMERIDLSDAFARGIVKQTVEELKVVLGTSMVEMQNQMRELIWDTFYKITGVSAGGTAMIVGHRYTSGYKKIQKKAINGETVVSDG